jgi:hypothetical protein
LILEVSARRSRFLSHVLLSVCRWKYAVTAKERLALRNVSNSPSTARLPPHLAAPTDSFARARRSPSATRSRTGPRWVICMRLLIFLVFVLPARLNINLAIFIANTLSSLSRGNAKCRRRLERADNALPLNAQVEWGWWGSNRRS